MSRRDLPLAVQDKKSLLLSCHHGPSVGGFANDTERLYFDFFRSKTTPGTNQFLESDFWEKIVLQLSHKEPAVKHAVLAISALHQQWDMYGSSAYEADRNALVQYSKGVGEAKVMLKRTQAGSNARKEDIEKVLVACILFVCFENLIGDYSSASLHLSNGLQILASEGMNLVSRGARHGLELNIIDLLNRFDFQAMTFSQTQFPLRKAATRFSTTPPSPLPIGFQSLAEVRIHLFEQVNWALAVDEVLGLSRLGVRQHSVKDPQTMLFEASIARDIAEVRLEQFWDLVESYVDHSLIPIDTEFRASPTYAYMRVYHRVARLITQNGCTGYECSWDQCMPEFEENLAYLSMLQRHSGESTPDEKCPLSLDVGICVPLYLIGNKCRDPALRRRIIAVLDARQRKEGIWESAGAARVIERLMTIEERNTRRLRAEVTGGSPADVVITRAEDIPEEARVQMCWTHVNMATRVVHMKCSMRSGDWDDPIWTSVSEKVEF